MAITVIFVAILHLFLIHLTHGLIGRKYSKSYSYPIIFQTSATRCIDMGDYWQEQRACAYPSDLEHLNA